MESKNFIFLWENRYGVPSNLIGYPENENILLEGTLIHRMCAEGAATDSRDPL